MKSFLWLILAGFLLLPGALLRANGLPDLGESDRAGLSPQAERRLGEQIMQEIRRDPAYLDDPEVAGYVSQLGRRLASHAEGVRPSFEFFVVKDS
ncbi:MAG: M48 family peptidase, partial [Rhodocyclaceae bacterium]|nr:M48 family peptidase [Rhodocyclaceae bacterium]